MSYGYELQAQELGSYSNHRWKQYGFFRTREEASNHLNSHYSNDRDHRFRIVKIFIHDNQAAIGYHGVISRPTRLLVGEAGPERVNVTPLRRRSTNTRSMLHRKTPSIYGKNALDRLAGL